MQDYVFSEMTGTCFLLYANDRLGYEKQIIK